MSKRMITHLLLDKEAHEAQTIYLRQPREGTWHEFSWGKVMRQARQVAAFLKEQGLKKRR